MDKNWFIMIIASLLQRIIIFYFFSQTNKLQIRKKIKWVEFINKFSNFNKYLKTQIIIQLI